MYNKYCTVTDIKGKVILAEFFEKVRMETLQTVNHSVKIADIDINKVNYLPEDGVVEKNMLYAKDGKVVCPKESGDITKIGLIDTSIKLIKIGQGAEV